MAEVAFKVGHEALFTTSTHAQMMPSRPTISLLGLGLGLGLGPGLGSGLGLAARPVRTHTSPSCEPIGHDRLPMCWDSVGVMDPSVRTDALEQLLGPRSSSLEVLSLMGPTGGPTLFEGDPPVGHYGSMDDQRPKSGSRGPKMCQNHPETSLIPPPPKYPQTHLETFFSDHFSPQIARKRLSP